MKTTEPKTTGPKRKGAKRIFRRLYFVPFDPIDATYPRRVFANAVSDARARKKKSVILQLYVTIPRPSMDGRYALASRMPFFLATFPTSFRTRC